MGRNVQILVGSGSSVEKVELIFGARGDKYESDWEAEAFLFRSKLTIEASQPTRAKDSEAPTLDGTEKDDEGVPCLINCKARWTLSKLVRFRMGSTMALKPSFCKHSLTNAQRHFRLCNTHWIVCAAAAASVQKNMEPFLHAPSGSLPFSAC